MSALPLPADQMRESLPREEAMIDAWRTSKFGVLKEPKVYIRRALDEMVEALIAAGYSELEVVVAVKMAFSKERERGSIPPNREALPVEHQRFEAAQVAVVLCGVFADQPGGLRAAITQEAERLHSKMKMKEK